MTLFGLKTVVVVLLDVVELVDDEEEVGFGLVVDVLVPLPGTEQPRERRAARS